MMFMDEIHFHAEEGKKMVKSRGNTFTNNNDYL
jgi:hypothetical protein